MLNACFIANVEARLIDESTATIYHYGGSQSIKRDVA